MLKKSLLSALLIAMASLLLQAQPFVTTPQTIKIQVSKLPTEWYETSGVGPYSEGRLFINNELYDKSRMTWSLLDEKGNVLSNNLHCSGEFNDGYVLGQDPQDGSLVIIDRNGKEIKKKYGSGLVSSGRFVDGYATIRFLPPGAMRDVCVYINTSGAIVFPNLKATITKPFVPLYDPRPFRDNLSAYYDYVKEKWGFIGKSGSIVIQPQFSKVHDFSEGLAAVQKEENGTWGFINTKGEYVLPSKFHNEPRDFHEGVTFAMLQNSGWNEHNYAALDRSGNILHTFELNGSGEVGDFVDGLCYVGNENITMVVDKEFKTVKTLEARFPVINMEGGFACSHYFNYILDLKGNILFKDANTKMIEGLNKEGYFTTYRHDNNLELVGIVNRYGQFVFVLEQSMF